MGGRICAFMTPSPTFTVALMEAMELREAELVTMIRSARLRGQG